MTAGTTVANTDAVDEVKKPESGRRGGVRICSGVSVTQLKMKRLAEKSTMHSGSLALWPAAFSFILLDLFIENVRLMHRSPVKLCHTTVAKCLSVNKGFGISVYVYDLLYKAHTKVIPLAR
jgi:hypothetical protein